MMAVWSALRVSELVAGGRMDAEYYQSRYIRDTERLSSFGCRPLGGPHGIAYVTDGIHESPDEVEEGGVRYLSAKCVKDNDFSIGDTLWISQAQHSANPRTSLRVGDVLIISVGATIGNVAVVQPDLLPANADRHLAIIRVKPESGVDPYFLAAFLNSEFGRFQSTREQAGNAQPHLYVEKIKNFVIPELQCSIAVSVLIRSAYHARLLASAGVSEAEDVLVNCLGLRKIDLYPTITYSAMLSDLRENKRFAAEFYMPAKTRALQALCAAGHKPLSHYVDSIREIWNPGARSGEWVHNFNVGHALEPFLDERQDPVDMSSLGSSKKRLRTDDVVISRLRSYLKQIAVVRCDGGVPCVGSSEFIVLRPKAELNPECLLAFLRSDPVQAILRWSQDGTNHPRFDERELLSVPVPDAMIEAQPAITEAVQRGIAARQQMKDLIRQAKAAIEAEIMGQR